MKKTAKQTSLTIFDLRNRGLKSKTFEHRYPESNRATKSELAQLRNIGKAMVQDFELLGIKSIKQLAKCKADRLYTRIQALTNTRHDPCVWDTYAAAIHQAKTGEVLAWWEFTKLRKKREANGEFVKRYDSAS